MKMRSKIACALISVVLGFVISASAFAEEIASSIYHNGIIITINDAQPRAKTVAVLDGKILAVSSKDEVIKSKGGATILIDLKGRTMPNTVRTMKAVAAAGELKIDVVSYPDVLVDRELIKREVSPTYKNHYRVAVAKLTIDGSPQGFTAWRYRPYYKKDHIYLKTFN